MHPFKRMPGESFETKALGGVLVPIGASSGNLGLHATLESGMDDQGPLRSSVLAKIQEQFERTSHLIGLLPADRLDWVPAIPEAWPAGVLLGHLLDCAAGFCAVLAAFEPQRLSHFAQLRELPVNHRCSPAEAGTRMAIYLARVDEGFALLTDADLGRQLSTVFVKQGELLLTLLLGNLEHLINHKHQLFTYLKLMGIDVTSRDLYRFRE
jgi:DinB superfamily